MSHFTHDVKLKLVGSPVPKIEFEAEFNEDGEASLSPIELSNINKDSISIAGSDYINKLCQLLTHMTREFGTIDLLKITKKEE